MVLIGALVLMSCGKRTQTSTEAPEAVNDTGVEASEEMVSPSAEGPTASVIIGRIASLWTDTSTASEATPACLEFPCEAKVEILAIEQMGSSYHGQFEAGTIQLAHFIFSLAPTQDILPELNITLPGLKEGDLFRAQVNYREHGPLQIGSYERLEQ